MDDAGVMAGGIFERIGEKLGAWTHTIFALHETNKTDELVIKDHTQAMHILVNALIDTDTGVIENKDQIDALGHRVVQGGESFSKAILIDAEVKKAIRDNNALAPLHNPANLIGIDVAEELFSEKPGIAVFDTEFHQTMPERAFLYALPYEYYTEYKVRKYGFHGTSHKYLAMEAANLLGKTLDTVNLITIHLGNGCSMCAVENGECKDTSMGMTPLAGIMMGTRTGDIDPAVPGFLLQHTDMGIKELESVLNTKSGLKGICGLNDLRDIHEARANQDERAVLALEMFCYQIKKYIGAFAAVLGSIDAIVFSGGVGENDSFVRDKACENLVNFGIEIDSAKNESTTIKPFSFHSKTSPVQAWVIPANEELQIAREVLKFFQ